MRGSMAARVTLPGYVRLDNAVSRRDNFGMVDVCPHGPWWSKTP